MYNRAYIRDGDSTTSHGEVRVPPITMTIGSPPRFICFEGSPVYCPACKSMGVTKCVPPFRPFTGTDGRQINLDGDLCICKCPQPPRLKTAFDTPSMVFDADEMASMSGAIPWLAYAGHEIEDHEIVFEIVDAKTGSPVEGMTYKLASGGRTLLDSKTLDNGTTKPYTINEHPNLSFVAWIKGDNK